MLNKIWGLMVICPIAFSLLNGTVEELAAGILSAGSDAITLVVQMAGGFMLWCGLVEILRQAGAIEALGRMMQPMLKRLFPKIKSMEAFSAITMNLAANMLGLGNAATPMGLEAMRLMARENAHRRLASHAMCMFLVVNSCCIQILPSTVITARAAAGSQAPGAILWPTILVTCISAVVGIGICLIAQRCDNE